jgi:hypothetical protein
MVSCAFEIGDSTPGHIICEVNIVMRLSTVGAFQPNMAILNIATSYIRPGLDYNVINECNRVSPDRDRGVFMFLFRKPILHSVRYTPPLSVANEPVPAYCAA